MFLKTIEAVFDGKVFRPTEPTGLESNTRVRITIESIEMEEGQPYSFLDAAMAANLDGPEDWSTNLDKYLYGDADEK